MKPVIAVDGPAASGKGTLARRLADALGVPYLDTGLLYRAVARLTLDDPSGRPAAHHAARLTLADTARPDLRTPDIDRAASRVSADPAVRAALLDRQRDVARAGGAVLDGRDIGTVIFPDAHAKLFVTATPAERARRRLLQRGEAPTDAAVAAEAAALQARDDADQARAAAPLRRAEGADLLDTTDMTPDQAFTEALSLVRAKLRPGAPPLDPAGD